MYKLWILVLTLSSSSIFHPVNSIRADLGLSARQPGCIWLTVDSPAEVSNPNNMSRGQPPPSVLLDCNPRTLNVDFWKNYTFNRDQTAQTSSLKIKCNDKLYFESFLTPNQSLFRLVNLKEVEIESCKIRKMPGRVWASLGFLRHLAMRSQNGEWSSSVGLEIEAGAFEGLGQVETLDLSQNNIWSLPNKNIFCPLKSLLKLNLSRNRLSDTEELSRDGGGGSDRSSKDINNSYSCALSVQSLDLSFNTLRRVGNNAFSHMKKLSELRLQNNLLDELEDDAFGGGLGQLRLLNMSSNRLVALPPTIFRFNPSLREINLSNNSISALSPEVVSGLQSLLSLDLSQNTLTSQWVKDNIFNGLSRLVVLKLSKNQLSYLDAKIFADLRSLIELHLDNNRIETINPLAFGSLSNLRLLDLSRNRLSFVDSRILSNLHVLRRLYLDHNKIRKMDDESLKNCTALQDLGLADNLLQEVPVALRIGLSHLVTLDIGENRIGSLYNDSFAGLGQLYGLRMVDNRLTELPDGFCSPTSRLQVLNIAQNLIKNVSTTAFISCPELKVLRLDSNQLETLPVTLKPQLPSLLWLNVSENRLTWADYHLLPPTIEWLDLSYNSLESIGGPTSLSESSVSYHLRVLDLNNNLLTSIDYTTIPPTLETLRVNHNQLKTVAPDTFIRSTRLRRVELVGNQLENLPLESLRFPPVPTGKPIPEFFLRDNPFVSDCSMEYLTRVNQLSALRTYPRIVDLDAIKIRPILSQSTTQGVISLTEAKPKDFLCTYKTHCFALCQCCDFDFCDCASTCPQNCTCYHNTAWSENIVQCSKPEDIPSLPMDSTEAYLDGGNITTLKGLAFLGRRNLRTLYLNDSAVQFISNKTFSGGLKSLEILHLEDNLLTEIQRSTFSDLSNLRELYLHNNLIKYIAPTTFSNLTFLQILRLDGNLLVNFNVWELGGNGYLTSITLSGNPWACGCEFLIPFRTWIASKTSIVMDFNLANCQTTINSTNVLSSSSSEIDHYPDEENTDGKIHISSPSKVHPIQVQHPISSMCNHNKELNFNFNPIRSIESELLNNHISAMGGAEKVTVPHPSEHEIQFSPVDSSAEAMNTFWTLLLTLTALIVLAVVIVAIFRKEIYYWLYSRLSSTNNGNLGGFAGPILSSLLCCCVPKSGKNKSSSYDGDESDKLFDCYLIYGQEETMVAQKIGSELESNRNFRLCLHHRDLCLNPSNPVGNTDMILSACDASKRVLLILSRTFLQSELTQGHFRQAIQSAINRHQKKLILILLPPFTEQNLSTIYPELKNSSVVRSSCLEWTDKNFWSKLKLILPTPSVNSHNCSTGTMGRGSSHLISGPPLIDLESGGGGSNNSNANTGTMSSYTINRLDYPYSSHHQYHQNILPYQIPMSNCSTLTAPVPKHHIALSAPFYHPNLPQQNYYSGSQHSGQQYFSSTGSQGFMMPPPPHHPGTSGSGALVYPMSTLPHQQHFSFNESFRRHLLQNQKKVPSHHEPSNNNNNTAYRPLEPNYSSSAISSSAEELEHVYSTLDSPLQSPNSANTTSTNVTSGGGSSGGSPRTNNNDGTLNNMCRNESANNCSNVVTPRGNPGDRSNGNSNNSNNSNTKRNSCRNNPSSNEFSSQNQSYRSSNSSNLPEIPGQGSNPTDAQPNNNGQMYFV